jgi:hypothetical protein
LRALRFRCARSVKQFSQRAQRLRKGATFTQRAQRFFI